MVESQQAISRREFIRLAGLASAATITVACTPAGTTTTAASGTTVTVAPGTSVAPVTTLAGPATLRMPFLNDMGVPDPDIMYGGEGLQLTRSIYEGLLTYKGVLPGEENSSEFAPGLATAWEISPDRLTYTFNLRSGVVFHDGTPMDADSWIKAFARRAGVNQGPAYMVANIDSATAPDPLTLVVKLKTPSDPFLHYLANPWGPQVISPTAVAEHTEGDDLAQGWLTANAAGTGPYVLKEFVPESHYTLEAFPDYWGTKPHFNEFVIEITPDLTTQRLKLESGEFDLATKGFSIEDIHAFQANSDFQVVQHRASDKQALFINATSGIFADKELRQALRSAIDREAVVKPAYEDTAVVSTQFYPTTMFAEGLAPDEPVYDPSILQGLVSGLSSKKVDLGYLAGGGTPFTRMAELIVTQLQELGLEATARSMPGSQVFTLASGPPEERPDLLIFGYGGDAQHVDTIVRIVFRTGAQPLNFFQTSNAEVDAAMDAALVAPTQEAVNAEFVKIAQIAQDEAWILNLADPTETVIARSGLTNIVANSFLARLLELNLLTEQ